MNAGVRLNVERLREVLAPLFAFHGCGAAEAYAIADHLIEADLCGHPSHGTGLVPIYVANLIRGEARPNRKLRQVDVQGGFLLFDGDSGFGQSLGRQLVEHIISAASSSGVAVFGLRNVHHLGRMGDYADRFARAGFASLLMVNTVSRAIVAPFGGSEPRMGTNPVCVCVPRRDQPPIVLDFATSAIAVGKCRVAHERGELIPAGCAIDADGRPTRDAGVLYASPQGALLTMGGHKGSGLNLMCELLAACIGGRVMVEARPTSGSAMNSLVGMAFRAAVVPQAATQVESVIDYFLATKPSSADGPVKLPGRPEAESRERLLLEGLPMNAGTWAAIVALAEAAGIAVQLVRSVASPAARP